MKKIFALTLITFAFALAQLVLPPKSVAVDNDVGICYVAPMDQRVTDMSYIANNSIPVYPDSRSSVFLGVEKSSYIIVSFSPTDAQCMSLIRLEQSTIANSTYGQTRHNDKNRDLGGLATGEVYPRGRAMPKHI